MESQTKPAGQGGQRARPSTSETRPSGHGSGDPDLLHAFGFRIRDDTQRLWGKPLGASTPGSTPPSLPPVLQLLNMYSEVVGLARGGLARLNAGSGLGLRASCRGA